MDKTKALSMDVNTTPSDESKTRLDLVLGELKDLFPHGATFADGQLVPMDEKPKVRQLSTLEELSTLAREPKNLEFDLRGQLVSVRIRPLDSDEAQEVDAIPDPLPPKKAVIEGGKKVSEEYDYFDPGYRAKASEVYQIKRAAIIAKGLCDMDVPGDTLEKKNATLRKMFPPQILDLLYKKILALTSDEIERAAFS